MPAFREYDMVALLRGFPEYGLEVGAIGCDLRTDEDTGCFEFPGPDFPFGGILERILLSDLRVATEEEVAAVRARNEAVEWDKLLKP